MGTKAMQNLFWEKAENSMSDTIILHCIHSHNSSFSEFITKMNILIQTNCFWEYKIFSNRDSIHQPDVFLYPTFWEFFKVWLNQHFFLTKAINCTVLKAKKGDANEILLVCLYQMMLFQQFYKSFSIFSILKILWIAHIIIVTSL